MYNILIFDLDDTLTNNLENVREAFRKVNKYRNEEFTEENFLKFYQIDLKVWSDRASGKLLTPYEDNKAKKAEWLRATRFIRYYGEDNISYEEAVLVNNIYMNGMKEKVVPRENCFEVIKYLYNKGYKIIIATNGPLIPLKTKIEKLNITSYIDTIFSGEEVGFMKPSKQFYEGLLKKANLKSKEQILFLGDDLEKDIKGGIENGIDTCWCNYNNVLNNSSYIPKYEIHNLVELKKFL